MKLILAIEAKHRRADSNIYTASEASTSNLAKSSHIEAKILEMSTGEDFGIGSSEAILNPRLVTNLHIIVLIEWYFHEN